jgi:hypothetical protein
MAFVKLFYQTRSKFTRLSVNASDTTKIFENFNSGSSIQMHREDARTKLLEQSC